MQAQRKKIMRDKRATAGTGRFLRSVNAVQAQVDALTATLAGIAARRATLSA